MTSHDSSSSSMDGSIRSTSAAGRIRRMCRTVIGGCVCIGLCAFCMWKVGAAVAPQQVQAAMHAPAPPAAAAPTLLHANAAAAMTMQSSAAAVAALPARANATHADLSSPLLPSPSQSQSHLHRALRDVDTDTRAPAAPLPGSDRPAALVSSASPLHLHQRSPGSLSCRTPSELLSAEDDALLHRGKYTLVGVVFAATLATSMLPWWLNRLENAVEIVAFCACLSAGVILGAGFSHMLVDARSAWETYFCLKGDDAPVRADYPYAELFAVATLLLLVTLDSALVRSGFGHGGDEEAEGAAEGAEDGNGHGHSHGPSMAQHGHSHAVPVLPPNWAEKRRQREAAAAATAVANGGPHGRAHRHPTDPPNVHHHHAHVHVRATPADSRGSLSLHVHMHPTVDLVAGDGDEDMPPPLEECTVPTATVLASPDPCCSPTSDLDLVVCPPCDDDCPPCDDTCEEVMAAASPRSTIPAASAGATATTAAPSPTAAAALHSVRVISSVVGAMRYGSLDDNHGQGHAHAHGPDGECSSNGSGGGSHTTAPHHRRESSALLPKSDGTGARKSSAVAADGSSGGGSLQSMRGSRRAIGQAYVFFVALAVHSIFDGMSIGTESTVAGFYGMLIAVGGHKLLDGFALGVPVMLADFPRKHTVFALVFCALMTPLGILIGMVATEAIQGAPGQLSKAIIISMSCGSFIFISLVELLPAGLSNGKQLLSKMVVVFLGWGAMAMLAIWV